MKEFVQNQVKLTDSVLEKCETKEKLRQNITTLFNHPRYDSLFRRGDKYFYCHNTGLQAHNVMYMQVFVDRKWILYQYIGILNSSLALFSHSHDCYRV